MKPEIKQRIEQLNNGKIPKGYQKTDFGVFPCDWVTDKKLIDIGTFGKGKGIPGNKMQSDGVPCVGYGDIYMKYNHFHFEEAQSFVDEETAKDSQLIKKGTLLFTGTGETAEEIGKCVCYNGDSTIYAGGDIITFVPQGVNPLFLAYQQYQNFSLKKKASFGQGHSVVHIQKESLEKLNVAYPESKKEQLRIVEILMKWDKAIELYDKQIDALTRYKAVCLRKMFPAKEQNVPEWRFQGFAGDWEQCKFVALYDYASEGGTPDTNNPTFYDGGKIPFVKIEDTTEKYIDSPKNFITEEGMNHSSAWMIPKDSILFSNGATVGNVAINKLPVTTKQGILGIIPSQKVTSEFLYYLLSNAGFQKEVRRRMATGTFATIILKNLNEISVSYPSNSKEQDAISSLLSEIDNLITVHQHKKEAITNQRKTLQQYLLNGIVRVR